MDTHLEFVKAFQSGEPLRWEDFIEHFDHQNHAAPEGPAVGSELSRFALADQHGRVTSIEDLAGPAGLLLVIVRTVLWCGYCRNQLAELDLSRESLRDAGVGVAAIAPDLAEVVREFALAENVGYPILCDANADYVESIGLLNTNLLGSEAEGGRRVPFPAQILLSPNGTIIAKSVAPDLRHRPSAAVVVMDALGPLASSPCLTIDTEELAVELSLSTNRVHTGQEIGVHAKVTVKPGWHVYGPSEDQRQSALSLHFEDSLIGKQQIAFPAPVSFCDEQLGEDAVGYEGVVEAKGVVQLAWSPPIHGSRHVTGLSDRLAELQMRPGDYELKGVLTYQACGHGVCSPPSQIAFSFPISVEADVDKTRAVFRDEAKV